MAGHRSGRHHHRLADPGSRCRIEARNPSRDPQARGSRQGGSRHLLGSAGAFRPCRSHRGHARGQDRRRWRNSGNDRGRGDGACRRQRSGGDRRGGMSLGTSESLKVRSGGDRLLRFLVETRELTLLALILAIAVAMSLATPFFLSLANFRAIAIGMAPTAIISIGMTVLLASGGFDLSVGSVLALASTVVALMLLDGAPIFVAVAAALLVGVVTGLLNGLVVTKIGVNPLVATLGSMSIARGIALVYTEGFSLSGLPPAFGWAGKADLLGVPFILWLTLAMVAIFDL